MHDWSGVLLYEKYIVYDNCRNSRALIGYLFFFHQYADRHMNLKFVRRVSKREWEIQ